MALDASASSRNLALGRHIIMYAVCIKRIIYIVLCKRYIGPVHDALVFRWGETLHAVVEARDTTSHHTFLPAAALVTVGLDLLNMGSQHTGIFELFRPNEGSIEIE